jgi:hypothetical protein
MGKDLHTAYDQLAADPAPKGILESESRNVWRRHPLAPPLAKSDHLGVFGVSGLHPSQDILLTPVGEGSCDVVDISTGYAPEDEFLGAEDFSTLVVF